MLFLLEEGFLQLGKGVEGSYEAIFARKRARLPPERQSGSGKEQSGAIGGGLESGAKAIIGKGPSPKNQPVNQCVSGFPFQQTRRRGELMTQKKKE